MIGGTDIIMRTSSGPAALDLCVRMICLEWPNAVFEDARSERHVHAYEDLSFSRLGEIFVYRDAEAAKAWQELGADESNQNTMIHILMSDTEMTVVVDDPHAAAMARVLDSIRAGLRMDILEMRAAA